MRRLRIAILIFALVTTAVFAVYMVYDYRTSDSSAPVINSNSDTIFLSVTAPEEDLLEGLTAYDNLDGDVTSSLVVVSKTKFHAKGVLRVNYAAFDNNNNVGTYSRTVTYTDYHSPHFSVSQPLRFQAGSSNYNYLKNITAYDDLDGDITRKIKVTYGETEAISDEVSLRSINLLVTNSAGDSSILPLNVTFENSATYKTQAPALRDYVIYTDAGTKPDLRGNLIGLWASGKVSAFETSGVDPNRDVSINDSGINYSEPGFYTASYQLTRTNSDGTRTNLGTANLIVVVEGDQ